MSQLELAELAVESDPGLDLGFDDNPVEPEDVSQYEPSFADQPFDNDVIVDVGSASTAFDDVSAVDDQFIRGAKFSAITMPWEIPLMRQIFEPDSIGPSLSMPLDWGSVATPSADAAESGASVPVICSGNAVSMFATKVMKPRPRLCMSVVMRLPFNWRTMRSSKRSWTGH